MLSRLFRRNSKNTVRQQHRRRRILAFQPLEERSLMAVLVSTNVGQTDSGNDRSFTAAAGDVALETTHGLSADGKYVVFTSIASDLTNNPNLGGFPSPDVYVRNLETGSVELVSVTVGGAAGGGQNPVISGNGRYVAFLAGARNGRDALGNANPDAYDATADFPDGGGVQVYVRDLLTDTTRLGTTRADGKGASGNASDVTITDLDDGTAFVIVIGFVYSGTDLSPLDTNFHDDVYIHHFNGNQNFLASRNPLTGAVGNGRSFAPVLAGDGSRVSFLSNATNLTAMTDTNDDPDLFSFQPVNDTLALVNVSASGGLTTDAGVFAYRSDNLGRRFVFPSESSELLPGVGNSPFEELYLREITSAGETTLVTRQPDGSPSGGQAFLDFSISGDGTYVAFTSTNGVAYTSDPVPPSFSQQVYLYDAISNFYILVSQTPDRMGANADSFQPILSQDGRYVLFRSFASDLTPGVATTPGESTLYVRDFLAGQTFPVSTNAAGTATVAIAGAFFNNNYSISRNGATVALTNLTDNGAYGLTDTNGVEDVFATAVSVLPVPAPTVTVNQAASQADPTDGSSIQFTVQFSLPVTGFGGDDLSFAGSTALGTLAGAITTLDFRTYTVTVTGMTSSGDVVLSIPAGAAAHRPPLGHVSQASTSTDNRVTVQLPIVQLPTIVASPGAGSEPRVRVFDPFTRQERFSFLAYDSAFTGGVRVAIGDISGDGTPDIITAAGPGGGPHVRVFDGVSGAPLAGSIGSFFAYNPNFVGGVFVASGDVNDDGRDDIISGAGAGGGPHIRVFSGLDGSELLGFFAYAPNFTGGVSVAAGDVNADGRADVVTGAGAGGGPHVRVFSGLNRSELLGFFAYHPEFRGGVFVAAGDVNGDGHADIYTGAGAGGGPHVRVFSGLDRAELHSFFAYNPAFVGGVRVSSADLDGDGRADIVTSAGPGGGPHVRGFSGVNLADLAGFFAYDAAFTGGVFVAGQAANSSAAMLASTARAEAAVIDPDAADRGYFSDLAAGNEEDPLDHFDSRIAARHGFDHLSDLDDLVIDLSDALMADLDC